MTPTEVLTMRADLARRVDDPDFAEYVQAANGWPAHVSAVIGAALRSATRMAETFAVSADMSRFTEHCAGELSGIEEFDPTMAPSTHGIVHFEHPVSMTDVRGATMLCYWLVWAPGYAQDGPKTIIWWFNDTAYPDDIQLRIRRITAERLGERSEAEARYKAVTGRWGPCGASVLVPGVRIGPRLTALSPGDRARIAAEGDVPVESVTNMLRVVYALWSLLGETVVVSEPGVVQRPARRMAKRYRMPDSVTTVTLRHIAYENPGPGGVVEWSHRWVVRGHWAWRGCSQHAPGASAYEKGWRVRRWISPYPKGPADLPLRVSEKVNRLSR